MLINIQLEIWFYNLLQRPFFWSLLFVIFVVSFFYDSTKSFALTHLKSEGRVHLNVEPNKYILTIEDKFHFNSKAPALYIIGNEKINPSLIQEKKIEFDQITKDKGPPANGDLLREKKRDQKITELEGREKGALKFYVCDDDNTVCEMHTIDLNNHPMLIKKTSLNLPKVPPDETALIQPTILDSASNASSLSTTSLNDLLQTLKSEKKKWLLLDFTASWCPACIRLNLETFPVMNSKIYKKQVKLIKIDIDLDKNKTLLSEFHIKAYPSLILVDDKGIEINRILDFVPKEFLQKFLVENTINPNFTLSKIKLQAQKGDGKAQLELAKHYYKSLDYETAIVWFQKCKQFPIEYYISLINFAEEKKNQIIESYEKSITTFPNSFYSLEWRVELARLLLEQKNDKWKAVLEDGIALSKEWLKERSKVKGGIQGDENPIELGDLAIPEVYYNLAKMYQLMNLTDLWKENMQKAIDKVYASHPTLQKPTHMLYLVRYMKEIKTFAEVTAIYESLQKEYPNEFTYYYRHASYLLEKKEFQKSLLQAERAESLSYGNNKIKTLKLIDKIRSESAKL